MAPPRTFDYDLLKRLVRDHPEWPYADYAEKLTNDARTRNPRAPVVLPDSVRRVVSQYRAQWQDEGVAVPVRGVINTDLLPPTGSVAANQRMSTALRYLREVSKQRRGEEPVTPTEAVIRRQALRWAIRLQENREIVDITEHGFVEVRPARADELDGKGNLLELAAWAIPGRVPPQRHSLRGRG
jgi:hypothetical protein